MSSQADDAGSVFDCRCCGECCRGTGGIILSRKDSERLAAHFHLPVGEFRARYAEEKRGKFRLRTGEDGACIFFLNGTVCGVHAAKPDICRAWPYFRGNLEDPASLAMAAEGCPGIVPKAPFAAFVAAGARTLLSEGVFCDESDPSGANSLLPKAVLVRLAGGGVFSGRGEKA